LQLGRYRHPFCDTFFRVICLSFVFFPFFKKTPFALPRAKVKSCRASVFASSIYIINEKCRFHHDLLPFLYIFVFIIAFSGKMATQKTKNSFSFFINSKSLDLLFFAKINHNSYAD